MTDTDQVAGMSEHTPGVWAAEDWGQWLRVSIGPERQILIAPNDTADDEDRANARLIAAAPDLLLAVRHAIGALAREGSVSVRSDTASRLLTAAFAKAVAS